jgi:hypothetical protein
MAKRDIHVVPSDGKWLVQEEGSKRVESTHRSQADAWRQAREVARLRGAEALLHGRNGQIRERSTYGRDPRRTKG